MCVSFRVIERIAPVSYAEQIPVQALGLGLVSLADVVPRPEVTNLKALLQSIGLGPLPLY